VTALTQPPAAIFSAAGIATQTLLPATLGCQITGSADESAKRVTLRVTCDKPIEVLAWWPPAWAAPKITFGNRDLPGALKTYGNEQFVLFAMDKGEWEVIVAGP
jgi:hypothetical protein